MKEQDHRIHSPELAHRMGYAEYPYHELATHALKLGLDKKHDEHMQDAHEAGIAVLREHVQSAQNSLDYFQKNSETHPSQNEGNELFKGVPIAITDFYNLAREPDEDENGGTRSMAGRVWATLELISQEQKNPTANSYYLYGGAEYWAEKAHLKQLPASRDIALDFGSLVNLFEETTTQDWLDIKNFGQAKYALLFKVIERKKAEVLAAQAQEK